MDKIIESVKNSKHLIYCSLKGFMNNIFIDVRDISMFSAFSRLDGYFCTIKYLGGIYTCIFDSIEDYRDAVLKWIKVKDNVTAAVGHLID